VLSPEGVGLLALGSLCSVALDALDARVAPDFFVRGGRLLDFFLEPRFVASCNLSRADNSLILAIRLELRVAFAFPVRSLASAAAMRAEYLVAMSRAAMLWQFVSQSVVAQLMVVMLQPVNPIPQLAG
jgi:hypothetical protein